jgi:hypothetical protein
MTLSLYLMRLVKDQENIAKESRERIPKDEKKEKETETVSQKNILSPGTIRRNVSADNFLKFQWPWTV